MTRPLIWAVTCSSLALSVAAADTVYLTNGGKVDGTIVELRLKMGSAEKTLSREQITSLGFTRAECTAASKDGAKYVGRVASVGIRCVAGTLTFDGKSVKSVALGEKPKPKKAKPGTDVDRGEPSVDKPAAKNQAAKRKLSPEERKHLQALIKKAAALRDEALARAAERKKAEYEAVKETYSAKWRKACEDVKENRVKYAKHATKADTGKPQFSSSGLGLGITRNSTITTTAGGAAALTDLNAAEARKSQLARTIKATKQALETRAHFRRERVRAYYYAIYRNLLKGKEIPEDAMKKIYDKAIKSAK